MPKTADERVPLYRLPLPAPVRPHRPRALTEAAMRRGLATAPARREALLLIGPLIRKCSL